MLLKKYFENEVIALEQKDLFKSDSHMQLFLWQCYSWLYRVFISDISSPCGFLCSLYGKTYQLLWDHDFDKNKWKNTFIGCLWCHFRDLFYSFRQRNAGMYLRI